MMNSLLRACLLAVVSTTAVVACAAQDLDGGSRRTIFVRSALAPPPDHADGACVFTATSPVLFEGTADLGLRDEYKLNVVVQANEGAPAVSIASAHVAVRLVDDTLLREFDAVTAGFVDAGGAGIASFTAIDPVTKDLIMQKFMLPSRMVIGTLTVEVELSGTEPSTGHDVKTPLFRFPVKVCRGCLVDFSTGNDPLWMPQPNCRKPAPANVHKPCGLGQDEPVPCQLCLGAAVCDPQTP